MNKNQKRTLSTIFVLCMALSMFSLTAFSQDAWVGDATEETALLRIIGAVEKPGYFSQEGLRAYEELVQTKTYNRLDHHGSADVQTVTGIYLEDLLKEIMTLSPNAVSITLTAGDGMRGTYYLDDDRLGVYSTDIDGNKLMLYFDGNTRLRLAVGMADENHATRGIWMQNVVSIVVNAIFPDELPVTKPDIQITGYTLAGTTRVGLTIFDYELRAFATNYGGDAKNVNAVLVDSPSSFMAGVVNLSFGNVDAQATAMSNETFKVRIDRTGIIDESLLVFEFIWSE